MGKRRSDADGRRFFDEFEKVRVSRFRATGVIDPARREALIPFPNGKTKLISVQHTRLKYGGGWSYFVCPKCGKRAVNLYLIDDAPRCTKCCDALNIKRQAEYGFGRKARLKARDEKLDELIAKLETAMPLRYKTPESWKGLARLVYNSRRLKSARARAMIALRLNQLADQQASERANDEDAIKAYQPSEAARQLIDVRPIWRATSSETLQKALDKAQLTILAALNSNDPRQRINAAKLMMRTKNARERGL
jgi:hypothetical protein